MLKSGWTTLLPIAALLLSVTSAEATTYYWDEDGTTSGFGTAGSTWTAPTVDLWSTDLTGETAPGGSITTTTSDALFFGTDTLGLAAGTITVSGTVSANSLTFGSASGAILLSGGTITLDGTTPTITVNNAADSISSIIAGTAGLSKDGGGTLTLTGTNTYTGGTSVEAGTLQLVNSASGNAILGAGHNYVVASGATLEFNRTAGTENISTFNLSGAGTFKTSGTAAIIQTSLGSTVAMGSGALFHVESGSYTFGAAGIGDWSSNLSDMQVDSGATFDGSATPIVVNALNGSGTVLTGGGITLGVDNGTGTFSGVIGNSSFGSAFSITKAGSGTQTLSGANTYTGTTTLAAGTLQADVADVAATSGALGNGGNITFTGGTLQYTANSAGTDYSSRIVNSTSAMKFDTNGQNVTLATDFARSNTSGLIKEGAGKLIVEAESGSAAFAGDKIVNGGTLQLFNNEVFNLGYANQGEFFINNGSTLEFAIGNGARHIIQGSKFTFGSNGGGTIDSTNSLMIVQNYGGLNTFTTTGGAKNLITGTNRFNLQNGNTLFFNVATGTDDVDLEVYTNITSGSIEKGGAGTLSLTNAANTLYSGGSQGITINAGTLEIGGAGRLQNGSFVGNINNAGIFKHNSTAGQTLSGVISGTGALVKDNTGGLTLSGANTYTGATTISAGTLQLGDGSTTGTLSASSAISVGSGATFAVNRSNAATQGTDFSSAAITGAGGFTQAGSGTTILNAANTYTGATTVSAGILKLQGDAFFTQARNYSIASGAVLNLDAGAGIAVGTTDISGGGTLLITGEGQLGAGADGRDLTLSLGSGALINIAAGGKIYNGGWSAIDWSSNLADLNVDGELNVADGQNVNVNALTGSGTISKSQAGNVTLQLGVDNGSGTFSGIIENGSGAIALTKSGSGTQTLSATNTYTGATTVSSGMLLVNGDNSAASGAVTVASGATLGGSGTIGGATTIQSGGFLAPGNSPGILTFSGDLTLEAGSFTNMEITGSTRGTDYDGIDVVGALTYGGTLTLTSNTLVGVGTYNLFDFASQSGDFTSIILSGTAYASGLSFTLDTPNDVWEAVDDSQTYTFYNGSGNLVVAVVVPEPRTYALLGGMFALTHVMMRRRRR